MSVTQGRHDPFCGEISYVWLDWELSMKNYIKFTCVYCGQHIECEPEFSGRQFHCPACKQLDTALQDVTNATIYTFLYPVIRPQLRKHSDAIWCSKDPSQAYFDLSLRGKVPEGAANCSTPIDKNLALGQKLRVNSTPTLYFKDGRRVKGARNPEQLSAILDETSR